MPVIFCRVSLYSVEANGNLKLQGSNGRAPELLPVGKGIPSHTAQTGQRYIVAHDVQGHELFDASIDDALGREAVNSLCAPALDIRGKAVAVLEVRGHHGFIAQFKCSYLQIHRASLLRRFQALRTLRSEIWLPHAGFLRLRRRW